MTEKTTLRSDQVRQPLVNTTAYWDDHATFIPKKGEIVVYSDGGSYEENGQDVPVPKIKIGDGITSVWLLHFTDDDKKGAGEHEVVYAECTLVPDIGITCNMSTGEIVELVEAGKVVLIKYGHDIYHITSYNTSKDPNVWGLSCMNETVKWIISERHAGHKLWRTEELSIPTVNDATLTIKKNGTTIDTFSANSDTDKTIDIRVPTNAADVSALPSSTKYAASLYLYVNSSTYVVTAQLKDQDGNNIGAAQTIDLPLESVVVNGSYNAQTKKVVLTLENGSTIEFSVADLVAGLQSEITPQNPLSADLVVDGNVNKVFTLTMKHKLDGIEEGAEVNVQSDWNQTDNTQDDYIKNKPTIPTLRTMNHEQLTDSTLGDINIHDGFYFPNAVQDYDGNWYGAVVIGDQVWLGENLRTTHYADGTAIPNGKIDDEHVTGSDSVAYYTFSDRCTVQIPLEKAGLVYNKTAVMNGESSSNANPSGVQGVAPDGWHIPSKNEFKQLHDYINSQKRYRYNDINDFIAKSLASTQYWPSNNTDGSMGKNPEKNNLSGFNAVPNRIIVLPSGNQWVQITNPRFDCATSTVETMSGSTFQTTYRLTSVQMGQTGDVCYILASSIDYFGGYHIVRCVSNLNPIQFRDWYINQYGSLQHHLPQEIPAQEQSDWNESDTTDPAFIKNKPTIPAAQVQSDWNATSGMGEILNKPTLAAVATSGSYSDLSNRPSVYDSIISFTSNSYALDSFTVNASQNKTIDIPDKTAWILKHDPDVLFEAVDIGLLARYSGISGFTSHSKITTLIDADSGMVTGNGFVFNPFKGFVYTKGGFTPSHKLYVSGKYTYRQICFTGKFFARLLEGPVFLITPMFDGTDVPIDECYLANDMSSNVNKLSVFLGWLMDSKKGAFELWPEHPIYYYDGVHFRLYSGAKDFTGDYTTLSHIPVLNTNNTTALTVTSAENITGTVNLHKIAKTGTYSDLIGLPTALSDFTNDTNFITLNDVPIEVVYFTWTLSGGLYTSSMTPANILAALKTETKCVIGINPIVRSSRNEYQLYHCMGYVEDSKAETFELFFTHIDGSDVYSLYYDSSISKWNYFTFRAQELLIGTGTGQNIKTINNTSLLGSGNINIPSGDTNVQSDWNQSDSTADDFIKNKPTITDEKVKQTVDATTTEYPLLVSAQSSPTSGTAYESKYSASLKATGEGDVVFVKNSTKCKLHYNSTDLCFNFVFE